MAQRIRLHQIALMLIQLKLHKYFLILLMLVLPCNAHAAEKLKIQTVAATQVIDLRAHILLPPGKKLNKQAPSKITVFEKINSTWVQAGEIKLTDYFTMSEKLEVGREINLKSATSRLKVTGSLYHCDRVTSQYCEIDDFEGEVGRDPIKSSNVLRVELAGSTF